MGYIREPKNVDLIVGPSEFNEAVRQRIAEAISQYKSTGKSPGKMEMVAWGAVNVVTHSRKVNNARSRRSLATLKRVKG